MRPDAPPRFSIDSTGGFCHYFRLNFSGVTMRVVFCQCAYSDVIDDAVRRPVLAALERADVELAAVPDLCALASRCDPRLAEWAADPETRIIACYPRTVAWLFHWAGTPLADAEARVLNMRTMDAGAILAELSGVDKVDSPPAQRVDKDGDWVPWFPVIDRDRCRNCRQCLNFCPFGVYELSDAKQVEVRHPANCKTNCPACARLCPDVAIIFPKYGQEPINGAPVTPAHELAQMHPDALKERLKKQDIHSMLAQRNRRNRVGCPFGEDAP